MKLWLKRLLLWVIGPLFLLLGGLYWHAQHVFSPEQIVRRLEQRFHLRAEIAAIDRDSFPARLEIRGLTLTERDDFARKATPLADRPLIAKPILKIERLLLDVNLFSFLLSRLDIRELSGDGIVAEVARLPDGDYSISRLFDKPDQPPKKKKRKRKLPGESQEREREEVERRFNADNLPVAAKLHSVGLSNVTIRYMHPKKKTQVTLTNGQLWLRDIDVDPKDLANHNRARIELKAKISVDRNDGVDHYGEFVTSVTGEAKPFDLETRVFLPEIDCQFNLDQGTQVTPAPLLAKLAKELAEYEKYGINVGNLGLKAEFSKEALLRLRYKDELFTLTDDSELVMGDYQLRLAKDSWFETDDHLHRIKAEVWVSPSVTETILSGMGRLVEDKAKVVSPKSVEKILAKRLVDNGRLRVRIETTGDIGDPELDLMKNLPDPQDIVEEALKEAAKDPVRLLKGIKKLLD